MFSTVEAGLLGNFVLLSDSMQN